ncbi:hypothetical protein U0070_011511, partial [Myodes glareolus]
ASKHRVGTLCWSSCFCPEEPERRSECTRTQAADSSRYGNVARALGVAGEYWRSESRRPLCELAGFSVARREAKRVSLGPAGGARATAAMLPPCSERELSELLARKEEEWRALQAHRAQMQEKHLEETRGQLQRLQEDFVYNLQVLEERDRELERYDVEFTQARRREEAQQAEVSELKIEVAKLKQALSREARHVAELQHQHERTLQEHHLELERVRSDRKNEIDHQQEQYENLKWKLERKLRELDGEKGPGEAVAGGVQEEEEEVKVVALEGEEEVATSETTVGGRTSGLPL